MGRPMPASARRLPDTVAQSRPSGSSLARTHRALVVEQTAGGHGIGARIVQELQERCFDELDHEILRVTGSQAAPVVSRPLNQAALAGAAEIANGLRRVMGQAA